MASALLLHASLTLDAKPPRATIRMLLVYQDDEPRRAMAGDFRALGWTVGEARDVRSAMEAAHDAHPHVILTGLQLPDADGFHFVRSFRSAVDHDVVLVGITRLPVHLCHDGKIAGLDMLFATPLDIDEVHRALVNAIPPDASTDKKATTKMSRLSRA